MLDPKEFKLVDKTGKERVYILHRIPAVPAREIMHKVPISNLPKLGDYAVSEDMMFKIMKYVSIELPGGIIQPLDSELLISAHVYNAADLFKIEKAMLDYNFDFFQNGWILNFLEEFTQNRLPKILKILMALLVQSSPVEKQPSTN